MEAKESHEIMKGFLTERQGIDNIFAAGKTVADACGRSLAQAALAWLRYRPIPVIPIIGARKLSQFQDNLASLDLMLPADQLKTSDEASQIELGFPYELYAREPVRGIRDGQ
jgi:aryl-alcohol dehydrogenase-like predicted oxidoreductase